MITNIQAQWEVNSHLRDTILKKIEKFSVYDNRIIHVDVFLKLGETPSPNDKLVEIRVRVPGPEIFAESHADTYEKAMANAAEKIRKQLVKRKEKRQNR